MPSLFEVFECGPLRETMGTAAHIMHIKYPSGHEAIVNRWDARPPKLYDEEEAYKTRMQPASVFAARDLPASVLFSILLRHNPTLFDVQIGRMVALAHTN